MFDADFAVRVGLINRVVAPAALSSETLRLAQTIAGKSSACIRSGKSTLNRQLALPLAEAYAVASSAMVSDLAKQDAREGIRAFFEKRSPRWSRH